MKKISKFCAALLALLLVLTMLAACTATVDDGKKDDTEASTSGEQVLEDSSGGEITGLIGPVSKDEYDINLVKMSQTAAYTKLSEFMGAPADYLDKTMKIKGDYYVQPSENGETTYYYIVMNDVTACCSAYIEILPDDCQLPAEGSDPNNDSIVSVIATGTIGSYDEYGKTYYVLMVDSIEIADT